ncbi:hypothetical protein POVWA2_059660 [Plasmodium ovale wallikeri]|uniref:Uncharacterized protein n=1 Tax=Plasmodium ovale wallikeri TaxID=864142 RepID=A0A1A8YN76_PLAOA|nr:hypothetical protein POVWA1_014850 [Plasmodium ovale wallikeri]SBT50180.1 hypothetical protein POVWA2_059660 [Plasmodium ovale wallikeri]
MNTPLRGTQYVIWHCNGLITGIMFWDGKNERRNKGNMGREGRYGREKGRRKEKKLDEKITECTTHFCKTPTVEGKYNLISLYFIKKVIEVFLFVPSRKLKIGERNYHVV